MAEAIEVELVRRQRSSEWLAVKAGIDVQELDEKLRLSRDFTVTDLAQIAAALRIDVSSLLPATFPR